MKKRFDINRVILILGSLVVLSALTGCSTFAVQPPDGMFLSTGDYVPEVETLGILQVKTIQFAPLFIYDLNHVRSKLYEKLIIKAQEVGADGLTNVQFYWKIAPATYFSMFIASGIFEFYMEGVAIEEK